MPPESRIRAVVCDVEGTTTPIDFVKQVLFPYAREHLPAYLRAHALDAPVAAELAQTRALAGDAPLSLEQLIALLLEWIAEDRKATPLKTLQGMVWEAGYRSGQLVAPVYPDVPVAFADWQHLGRRLFIYSSGSIAAQKLLFAHSSAGDLTPRIDGYFDTSSGGKLEPNSYRRIAAAIGLPAAEILFLSDHAGEVAAARAAQWQAMQVCRDGAPAPSAICSFADLSVGEAAADPRSEQPS